MHLNQPYKGALDPIMRLFSGHDRLKAFTMPHVPGLDSFRRSVRCVEFGGIFSQEFTVGTSER